MSLQDNPTLGIALPPEMVRAIAVAVVDELEHRSSAIGPTPGDSWLTAAEYAERHKLSRSTVYARATELGARRIGRALRFPATSPETPADERMAETPKVSGRQARTAGRVELLPIGGGG